MPPTDPAAAPAATAPADGVWRPLLRTRLVGRAEPLFVDTQGLRSAASIWSGALVWARLLRGQPDGAPVVVWRTERLALLQLLVAALWDGRTLQIEPASRSLPSGAWCVDGPEVRHGGRIACQLGSGGWPDLAGPGRMSTLDMLTHAPAPGEIGVPGARASHGALWLALGAPLDAASPGQPVAAAPGAGTASLPPFDLASLATPQAVLNDALLPLLRCTEVWDHGAAPAA